jgi:23S rRNA (uracil1939-C5)-methyltransferase
MHMNHELQSKLKKQFVLDSLNQAGIRHIRQISWHDAPSQLRYRNRTDLVYAEIRGKRILGSYMPRSHRIIATQACMILRAPLNQIIAHIVEIANKQAVPAYQNFPQPGGALRYVSLFANSKGKVIIDLVCKSADGSRPSWLMAFVKELSQFAPIEGISWSINDSPNNAIRVNPSECVWGKPRIPEYHHEVQSLFTASGFTQLNTEVAARIYETARDWFSQRPQVVWDLYCGAGAFGRSMRPARLLYGAEFNSPAIAAAQTVSANDPWQSQFEVIDLEKNWPQNWEFPDVILVDPPRKGLSNGVVQQLAKMHAPIVYMSCNPVSFARNVASLAGKYILDKLEAFDMMPQTRHLEVLGLLRHI